MEQILSGLSDVFTLTTLIYIALGITMGIFVGAVPGLNGPMAIAIAVPLTFFMSPLTAITFLVGILKGSRYGGSISAILLNTPGDPEAAATCFDGYPLALQGKAEKALKMALYASVFGDSFSDLVLIIVAGPIALIALKMGPPEITAVILFALTIIAAVSGRSLLKGLIAAAFGIFINCVGLDPVTATPRLCMGSVELQNGIPLMAIGIGMLALSEVLVQIEEHAVTSREAISFGKDAKRENRTVSFREFKENLKTILRSSLIGTGVGALPGLGATIAAFLGYAAAKRASKTPEHFGKGTLEGVAAAEAANNAVVGANLIPLFTLGIPGNVAAAILIGAFMIHGVTPGPLMFQEHGRLIYGIYGAFIIANGLNLAIGNFGLRFFAKVMMAPKQIVYPVIAICCVTGAYMADNSLFAVGLMIIFAILGYFMKKLDFSFVTFIIGFVLGPILELSLRQTLVISKNNPMILLERPVSLILLILTVLSIWRLGFRSKKVEKLKET
jgi:putative tricarboxylic transport membrane protein